MLAERCRDFSGADLRGIVTTAQLAVVHELIEASTNSGSASSSASADTQLKPATKSALPATTPRKSVVFAEQLEQKPSGSASAARAQAETKADDAREVSTLSKPIIFQRHFLDALRNTSASLSDSERSRFDRIYKRFLQSKEDRGSDFDPKGKLRTSFA